MRPAERLARTWAVIRQVARSLRGNTVTDSAAQLAYYVLFSAFPFLLFLVTLAAYLPVGPTLRGELNRLALVMPSQAYQLIQQEVDNLFGRPRPRLLTLGFALALYSASRGVDSFRRALNLAYGVQESRPRWKTLGIALEVTVAGTILVLAAIAIIPLGGQAGIWLFEKLGLGDPFARVLGWIRLPITVLLVMLAVSLAFHVLPNVRQRFRYFTPGAVLGTLAWLAGTWGFRTYVAHFGRYSVTYGSLGGVILLITWIYISGFVFIVGGEINAAVDHLEAPPAAA